jgi:hypothetical protein
MIWLKYDNFVLNHAVQKRQIFVKSQLIDSCVIIFGAEGVAN